ncbi:hypothetical protein XENTR_v10022421 [Xenopus tropicalis]|uniref:Uncharacterized protein LOC116406763 isoform X2 n=1 Tax=Xenopus tropicalis TaxID=8364 RepID=A0A8J1IRX7_XENTR|nr:uncharacterized protein LOC116406763 isoform X2 [Xenopus tropicalis]KAE8588230.1 hypothetical protein XENTR_v10022421 [Xenopus tropicalis]
MKPIELVFFLSLVLQICSVTGNGPVPVIDHVEGSVVLPYSLSVPVREAYWDFPCNGHRVKVAEFRDQKFSITREEFRSRMDCSDNGTSLMIRNLRMNDSGIYTALIYDTEQRRHEISYNLTVFINAENKRLRVLLIGATVPVLLAVVIAVFLITRIQIKMKADIIYKEIQVFPKKSTNQENGTDSKGLLYQETTYVDVKR